MKKSAKPAYLGTLLQCVDQMWPRNCAICQRSVANASTGECLIDLCKYCTKQLVTLNCHISTPTSLNYSLCPLCGTDQFVTNSEASSCGCDAAAWPFRQVVAPFRYAYPVSGLIHLFKYKKRVHWGRVLGLSICGAVDRHDAEHLEVLLPVPMTRRKLAKRGFNPAEDLARVCGRHFGIPVRCNWAQRLDDTPSMAGLSRFERLTEIRGAFSVSDAVANQHVGIIDDVLTTGATSVELARELLDSGARSVSLWVVARTADA